MMLAQVLASVDKTVIGELTLVGSIGGVAAMAAASSWRSDRYSQVSQVGTRAHRTTHR